MVERKLFSMETGSKALTCFYGNYSSSYQELYGGKKGQKVTNAKNKQTKLMLVYFISVLLKIRADMLSLHH